MATNWLVVLKAYVDTLETIVGTEGGVALANKLTAARATLLDQITALRLAELDAANIPADVDTLKAAIGAIEGATTLHNKLTAARAAFLDAAISSRSTLTQAQIISDVTPFAGANVALIKTQTDKIGDAAIGLAAIKAYVDLIDDATNGLAAIKAEVEGLAGAAMRGTDGAALAASWTAGLAAILANFTAARIGYLDNLSAGAVALAATALTNVTWTAALATALGNYTAARAGYLDNINQAGLLQVTAARAALLDQITAARLAELDAANIPADVDTLKASHTRQLFSMDFWSLPQEEVAIPAVAATLAMPSVVVGDLPAGAVIVRAIALVKFRMIENINVAANTLDGATVAATSQVIQVQDSAAGGWVDAINFVNLQFGLAAATREGGDALIGSIDIAVRVDANDTYSVRYLLAKAALLGINWNDMQCGLRIWYSV